jgi:competence protein ComEA
METELEALMNKKLFRLMSAACLLAVSLLSHAEAPLDINTANADALAEVLVGVGPAKAEAIVAFRESNGPFASVEQLAQVKGIGERTLELNRERITVAPSQAE